MENTIKMHIFRHRKYVITMIFVILFINSIFLDKNTNYNSDHNNMGSNNDIKTISQDHTYYNMPNTAEGSYGDYIDGVIIENINSIQNINDPINLELNNSMKTFGMHFNITDINETREYIENGNFNSDINSWNVIDEDDVNLFWNSSYLGQNGVAQLNLTGLEEKNNATKSTLHNGIDTIPDIEDWIFNNGSSSFYDGKIVIINPTPDGTNSLQMSWGWEDFCLESGVQLGEVYSNFTYNGTNNLADAELSFDYNMAITGDVSRFGILNLSVYIIHPSGKEFWIDNWVSNLEGDNEVIDWTKKNFNLNELKGVFNTTGNYTLKFKANHYHSSIGSNSLGSRILVDNIKLELNYTKKEFLNGSEIYIKNEIDFYKIPQDYVLLNFSYVVTEPFTQFNNSGSEIFFKINNNQIFSQLLNETEINTWFKKSFPIDKSNIGTNKVNLTVGIRIGSETNVTFYPNQTWSLFIDNISLVIKATPKISQINLTLCNPNLNRYYQLVEEDFGKAFTEIENNSILWFGNKESLPYSPYLPNENQVFLFDGNSTNVTISYSIRKFGLSWKDTIYSELLDFTDHFHKYLISSQNMFLDTNFPVDLIKDLVDAINYTSKYEFDNALKYASKISPQFGNLLLLLIFTLNGTFYNEYYNDISEIDYFDTSTMVEKLSLGSISDVGLLFQNLLEDFEKYNNYDYSEIMIRSLLNTKYNSYISNSINKIIDIREKLININLNADELDLLNLSAIYQNIQFLIDSMSEIANGYDTKLNIDPLNSLKDWGCSENFNSIINKNDFSGLFLGNIPSLGNLLNKYNNESVLDPNQFSTVFQFLSKSEYFSKDYQNIIQSISMNPFGIFGLPSYQNITEESHSFSDNNNFNEIRDLEGFQNNILSISSQDFKRYVLLILLIEDQILKKTVPLTYDYTYKSILSILEKSINSVEDSLEFNQTEYNGEIQYQIPNYIDNFSNAYIDYCIKNTANDSNVQIKQQYYLPIEGKLVIIGEQFITASESLLNNEEINIRVPIQSPDTLYINNIIGPAYGIEEISNQMVVVNEIYFGNRIISKNTSLMTYIPSSDMNLNKPLVDIGQNIENSIFSSKISTNTLPNNDSYCLNISKILYQKGLVFNDFKDSIINILIQENSKLKPSGQQYIDASLNNHKLGFNFTNSNVYNDIDSISLDYSSETGLIFLQFDIEEVMIETGLINQYQDPNQQLFEQEFIFNITNLNSNFYIPIEILVFGERQKSISPFILKTVEYNIDLNDISSVLTINIPIGELSQSESTYFRINKLEITFDLELFNENYGKFYTGVSKLTGNFYNIRLLLYTITENDFYDTNIILNSTLELFNGTKIDVIININLHINNFYRFKPPISPNFFITLTFGAIIFVTLLFVKRNFMRYFIKTKLKQRDFVDN